MNHYTLLFHITYMLRSIEHAQGLIDLARELGADDSYYQLELDRLQTRLDVRRKRAKTLYEEIPLSN